LIQQLAIEASFDLLDLHVIHPQHYPHLLESSAPGPQGRFDTLFAFPAKTIAKARGMLYALEGLSG
jgi:hypothetical protein